MIQPLQPIQFGATLGQARSGHVSLERAVNLYLEKNPEGAKSPVALYGTPGLKPFVSVGSGPIRGIHSFGNLLYVVSGQELYSVDRLGSSQLLGQILGTGAVRMANNATHVAVCTSGPAYAANAAGIVPLPVSGLRSATYQDGYGIFVEALTQRMWISGLDDMTTIDPLDYTTADALPDNVVGVISDHREVWVFKERSVEVWYNSGAAAFPFSRAPGGFIERGCLAPGSIDKADNTIYWLGDDGSAYAAAGYQAQKISPPWVDAVIQAQPDRASAEGFVYRQGGHVFWVLSFSARTLVYDITTGLWHERSSAATGRWRASHCGQFGEANIVGDCETGELYELDLDTCDDDGASVIRESICPPRHGGGYRVRCNELVVDLEAGVGLVSGQGSAPLLMLSWSDDDGASWSNELTADIGAAGKRQQRVSFARLGQYRQRSYRLRISDPIKVAITGAWTREEVLAP